MLYDIIVLKPFIPFYIIYDCMTMTVICVTVCESHIWCHTIP